MLLDFAAVVGALVIKAVIALFALDTYRSWRKRAKAKRARPLR